MKRASIVALWVAVLGAVAALTVRESIQSPDGAARIFSPDDRAPSDAPTLRERAGFRPGEHRGGTRHAGVAEIAGPSEPALRWRFETGAPITAQAVLAPDGRIVVGSHDHFLYVLDARGRLAWKRDLGGPIYAAAAIDADGTIFVGSDADVLVSFAPDGTERFRIATDADADTAPVLAGDDRIYFAAGRDLFCAERGGRVHWRFRADGAIYTSPAVASDGTIVFGALDDRIYALAPDGRMRWSLRAGGDVDGSPAIGLDGTTYVGADDGKVRAIAADGTLRWTTDVRGYVRSAVAVAGEAVYVTTLGPRPRLVRLAASDGAIVWELATASTESADVGILGAPLVDARGTIVFGAPDDFVYAVTPEGSLRWTYRAGGDVDAPPWLGPDGTLYIGSYDGFLHAIAAPASAGGP